MSRLDDILDEIAEEQEKGDDMDAFATLVREGMVNEEFRAIVLHRVQFGQPGEGDTGEGDTGGEKWDATLLIQSVGPVALKVIKAIRHVANASGEAPHLVGLGSAMVAFRSGNPFRIGNGRLARVDAGKFKKILEDVGCVVEIEHKA